METPLKIEYVCNTRSRSIRVRITSDYIRVSYPTATSRAQAEGFVSANWEKICAKQQQLRQRQKPHMWLSPENSLQTLTFSVQVVPETARRQIQATLQNAQLRIFYPSEIDLAQAQPLFWNSISYFLRKEAKRILPNRVAQLAAQHGFTFTDVKIQRSRSRWGSCSRTKHINLSFYLLLAPAPLVDYVILHELCHTVEMNHGAQFWALLNRVTDNQAQRLRQELKKVQMPA